MQKEAHKDHVKLNNYAEATVADENRKVCVKFVADEGYPVDGFRTILPHHPDSRSVIVQRTVSHSVPAGIIKLSAG